MCRPKRSTIRRRSSSKRVWRIPRNRPDRAALEQAAQLDSRQPASADRRRRRRDLQRGDRDACAASSTQTGIPVGETMAGKGSLRFDHPLNLGAIGATGTFAANRARARGRPGASASARATATSPPRRRPRSRIRPCASSTSTSPDSTPPNMRALPLVGDARATLDELLSCSRDYQRRRRPIAHAREQLHDAWEAEVERIYGVRLRAAAEPGRIDRRRQRAGRSGGGHGVRRRAVCPATCTSCGARAIRSNTTSNTATR